VEQKWNEGAAMNAFSSDISYSKISSPPVLLFGDDACRRDRLAQVITASGGRVVANGPVSVASERLAIQAASAGVVVDLRDDDGPMLDDLLTRLDSLAVTAGRLSALVLTPQALIDVVAARIVDPGTAILVEPEPGELGAALAEMLAPSPGGVEDGTGEGGNRRLAQLSEEVGRIARALAALSQDEHLPVSGGPKETPCPTDGNMVRAILRLRRLRAQFFMPALFADPAWDILLDLMIARIERRRVAASSLCIAAAVPATTALRWITQMTDQHMLVRQPDPRDGRRVFITLSEQAATAMEGYLGAARQVMAPMG